MMDQGRAAALAEAWRGKRIAVLGDLMIDRYVWGTASRISQEAPIPVVEVKKTTTRPGGAANVLYNIASLGALPVAYGVVGDDDRGRELVQLLGDLGVETSGLIHVPGRMTTEKERIIAGNQQVVRVDREQKDAIGAETAQYLGAQLAGALAAGALDGVILEDYAKGLLTKSLCEEVVAAARKAGAPVALDPHPANVLELSGLSLMTPNHAEAFALAGRYLTETVYPLEEDLALAEVAAHLAAHWEVENLLITLGAGGMALYRRGEAPLHVPTQAREVFDVSGAGDTVIAAYTLALAGGASPAECAVISNHAAGVVVAKVGTAPCPLAELLASFS